MKALRLRRCVALAATSSCLLLLSAASAGAQSTSGGGRNSATSSPSWDEIHRLVRSLEKQREYERAAHLALRAAHAYAKDYSSLSAWDFVKDAGRLYLKVAHDSTTAGAFAASLRLIDSALVAARLGQVAGAPNVRSEIVGPAQLERGRVASRRGLWRQSIAAYQLAWSAIEAYGYDARAESQFGIANAYWQLSRADSAAAHWSTPDVWYSRFGCAAERTRLANVGFILRGRGRAAEAAAFLDSAVAIGIDLAADSIAFAIPQLVEPDHLTSQLTLAIMDAAGALGQQASWAAAAAVSEESTRPFAAESLAAWARYTGGAIPAVALRQRRSPPPKFCQTPFGNLTRLTRIGLAIAVRHRVASNESLVLRRAGDSLFAFAFLRSGEVVAARLGGASDNGTGSKGDADSWREKMVPLAKLLLPSGVVTVVHDSTVVIDKLVAALTAQGRRVEIAPSIIAFALALPVLTASKGGERPFQPTIEPTINRKRGDACRLPLPPPLSISALDRTTSPRETAAVHAALARQMADEIDSVRFARYRADLEADSAYMNRIDRRTDLALSSLRKARAIHERIGDERAAADIALSEGALLFNSLGHYGRSSAAADRVLNSRDSSVAAAVANARAAQDTVLLVRALTARIAAKGQAMEAKWSELLDLAMAARDRFRIAEAMAAVATSRDSVRLDLLRRAIDIGMDQTDIALAIESLPDSMAIKISKLMLWLATLSDGHELHAVDFAPAELVRLGRAVAGVGDSLNAGRLLHVAAGLIGRRRYSGAAADSAQHLFLEALVLRRAARDTRGESRTQLDRGKFAIAAAKDTGARRVGNAILDSAYRIAHSALALREEGEALQAIEDLRFRRNGDRARFLASLSQVAQLFIRGGDSLNAARTLHRTAVLHYNAGRLDSALAIAKSAVDLASGAGSGRDAADAGVSFGIMLRNAGRLKSADSALWQAVADSRRALDVVRELRALRIAIETDYYDGDQQRDHGPLNGLVQRIARDLELREHPEILDQEAISYSLLGREDSVAYVVTRRFSASAHTLLASVWLQSGCIDSAKVEADRSGFTAPKDGDMLKDAYERARVLETLAAIKLGATGSATEALEHLSEAREAWELAGRPSQVSQTSIAIARVYESIGRSDSAAFYRRSASAVPALPNVSKAAALTPEQELAAARDRNDHFAELKALVASAERERRGERNLTAAAAFYDSAAFLASSLVEGAGSESNRVFVSEQSAIVFGDWALTSLARKTELGPAAASSFALAIGDRGRGRILRAVRRTSATIADMRSRGSAPDDSTILSDYVPAIGSDLSKEAGRVVSAARGQDFVAYLATQDTLLIWLRRWRLGAPDLVLARVPVGRDSIARLVAKLRRAMAVDSARSRITRTGEIGTAKARSDTAVVRKAFVSLREVLFPPGIEELLPDSGSLVIIPSGPIALVPIAAVPRRNGEPLGAALALRYSPSIRALGELEEDRDLYDPKWAPGPGKTDDDLTPYRDNLKWQHSAVIVGNPKMPAPPGSERTLPPLSGAFNEAEHVSALFGVKVLTAQRASEVAVRASLGSATVIHLATHGMAFVGEEETRQSFVALAPTGVASQADGRLTVGELLDEMSLFTSADLVTLSACQTGLGSVRYGEGVLGLQRAFLAKGAKSVLGSLWSVSDDATAVLMERFYRHWLLDKNRPNKAESLRLAQNEMRADRKHPEWRDPRFWAAFQLVGLD